MILLNVFVCRLVYETDTYVPLTLPCSYPLPLVYSLILLHSASNKFPLLLIDLFPPHPFSLIGGVGSRFDRKSSIATFSPLPNMNCPPPSLFTLARQVFETAFCLPLSILLLLCSCTAQEMCELLQAAG